MGIQGLWALQPCSQDCTPPRSSRLTWAPFLHCPLLARTGLGELRGACPEALWYSSLQGCDTWKCPDSLAQPHRAALGPGAPPHSACAGSMLSTGRTEVGGRPVLAHSASRGFAEQCCSGYPGNRELALVLPTLELRAAPEDAGEQMLSSGCCPRRRRLALSRGLRSSLWSQGEPQAGAQRTFPFLRTVSFFPFLSFFFFF